MDTNELDLNTAVFVGIDAHQEEHTACVINRFEEEKGTLQFRNNKREIKKFLGWLPTFSPKKENVVIGVEGGGNPRHALVSKLVSQYEHVYEVNPICIPNREEVWEPEEINQTSLMPKPLPRF